MTVQAALCQIKLQGTYSSAIQHCMASLVVFGKVKTGVIFWKQASRTPPPSPPCFSVFINAYHFFRTVYMLIMETQISKLTHALVLFLDFLDAMRNLPTSDDKFHGSYVNKV